MVGATANVEGMCGPTHLETGASEASQVEAHSAPSLNTNTHGQGPNTEEKEAGIV